MPTSVQASINPNDFASGGKGAGFQKKQFSTMNQHYISHNAVLPGPNVPEERTRNQGGASPMYKDPYRNIPMKPNQMTYENSSQLQNSIGQSTPAGVISELRKSSPTGHVGTDQLYSYSRDPNGSVGRAGNAIMSNYNAPDYGSVKKVMPLSRDPNLMGNEPIFSSKPSANYQSIEID